MNINEEMMKMVLNIKRFILNLSNFKSTVTLTVSFKA